MGTWETAQLNGTPHPFMKPSRKAGEDPTETLRYTFERRRSPTSSALAAKTGGWKVNLPVGDIEGYTGKSDIDILLPHKEPLGMAWSWAMAQPIEQLASIYSQQTGTDITPEQMGQKSWQEMGAPIVEHFRTQMLRSKEEGGLLREMTVGGRQTTAVVGDFLVAPEIYHPFKRPNVPYRELERFRRQVSMK